MKVGDLVKRKITSPIDKQLEKKSGKYGFILKIEDRGTPPRPRADVFWSKSGKVYSIGGCYIEVVSESR